MNYQTPLAIMILASTLTGCRSPEKPAPQPSSASPTSQPAATQPAAAQPAPKPAGKPAVLFAGALGGWCDYEFARWLVRDGFEVNSRSALLDDSPLTWDEVKPYNVLVLSGIGMANADGSLSDKNKQTSEVVHRFLQAGGGVFFVPSWTQMNRLIPPQTEFLKPLGLTPLFEEMVFDRETARATAWRIDFAYTSEVKASPVTTNVSGLWVPVGARAGHEDHLVPFQADKSWDVVLTGSPASYTITTPLTMAFPSKEMTTGQFTSRIPLVATRQVGPGRMVVCAINHSWLWGRWAGLTLEGVTLDRGLRGKPSNGYELVLNSLRWLAQPSDTLGGAKTQPVQLENPFLTKFCAPTDWSKLDKSPFPSIEKTWPGVIGARTTLSGGKGTVAEWVAAAKAAGLGYLVFLEDFSELTEKEFDQLKAECAKLTTADFAAIPGFRIRDEIGNYYFYAAPALLYPPKQLLSDDGKVFVAYDPEISPKDPRAAKGQLNMTIQLYTYQFGGFKMTAGNYFFHRDASPVANWFSQFTAVGVITRQDGQVVEDATPEYLQIAAAGQGPLPVVVDLLDDPAQLAHTPWRTVLRMKAGDATAAGKLDTRNPVAAYFSQWNFYPDNPTRIFVTDGPQIDYWSMVGPHDYEGANRGDFVWQNYRLRYGGKVRSDAGLKEVAVYDGPTLFRRFLPGGAKEFKFELDLENDKQRTLLLLVTDKAGRRAISQDQWNRNHRLEETNCSDRNNQLTYGYNTRRDGTYVQLGGNNPATTPNKRVLNRHTSPSGTFKNDPFLGAAAFDGAAGGEPEVHTPVILRTTDNKEINGPMVGEGRRVMDSGDVNIGEGISDYRFTDNATAYNVWHSMWKTEPSQDLVVTQRNHFFQIDPNSPIATYLWRIHIGLRSDEPTRESIVGFLNNNDARLWAVRSSNGTVVSGSNEETPLSTPRTDTLPFGFGAYAAALDSPLGGAAVFPLTEGLDVMWPTPQTTRMYFVEPAATALRKKGDSRDVDLLLVGIPRSTRYTRMFGARTTEVIERFRRDFGLSDAGPGYKVSLQSGKIVSQRYLMRVDGDFSGVIEGDLISTLPIVVGGLNDRWSAFLYDRQQKAARPVGLLENQAWATVPVHGKQDLFVGHPVSCDNREVFLQLTQTGEQAWALEVHNPTDAPVTTPLRINPFFDPLKGKTLPAEPVVIPAGASKVFNL